LNAHYTLLNKEYEDFIRSNERILNYDNNNIVPIKEYEKFNENVFAYLRTFTDETIQFISTALEYFDKYFTCIEDKNSSEMLKMNILYLSNILSNELKVDPTLNCEDFTSLYSEVLNDFEDFANEFVFKRLFFLDKYEYSSLSKVFKVVHSLIKMNYGQNDYLFGTLICYALYHQELNRIDRCLDFYSIKYIESLKFDK